MPAYNIVAYPFQIVEISLYLIMVQYIGTFGSAKVLLNMKYTKRKKGQMKNFSYFQSNPFSTYSATQSDLVFTKQQ